MRVSSGGVPPVGPPRGGPSPFEKRPCRPLIPVVRIVAFGVRGGLGRAGQNLENWSWTLLGLILPRFFAFVLNFDVLSIFFRFWMGFESVLGGQNGRKIEIFGIFLDMLVETLFLVEIC